MSDSTTAAFQQLRQARREADRLAEDIYTSIEALGDQAPVDAPEMLVRAEHHARGLAAEYEELGRVARFAELLDGQVRQKRRQRQR